MGEPVAMEISSDTQKRLLAVASGGGHWEQLMQLRDAFGGHRIHYATTLAGLPERENLASFSIIPDCNRDKKIDSLRCVVSILKIVIRIRPQAIITTGSLPGVIALAIGKLFRIKTIWVDSVANAETLSMSGMQAKRFADLWITQWEHVAKESGAVYAGSVL